MQAAAPQGQQLFCLYSRYVTHDPVILVHRKERAELPPFLKVS